MARIEGGKCRKNGLTIYFPDSGRRAINCSHCCTGRNLSFHVENSQHADKKQLTWQQAFDLHIESTHRQPASCRARPVNVDDGPEDIRCIRVLGGEKLPAASYSLLLNLKKSSIFPRGDGSRIFVACFLHSSAQTCLYQTPGRRPPRITGRFVNTAVTTVQISWRGRWFCRSMSVEDSESRRFELIFGGVFSGWSWLNICPWMIFFVFF